MKIDVRDLDYLDEDECEQLKESGKKKVVKTRIHDEFKKKDNRKFNKHVHKIKKGFEDDEV